MNSKITPQKKAAFLAALAATCSVRLACEAAGISRQTAYIWREVDDQFYKNWQQAKYYGAEALEDEAVRRGMEGYDEKVFYQGVAVGTIRKYSDKLLTLLLQGAIPEKYNMNKYKPVDLGVEEIIPSHKTQEAKEKLAAQLDELLIDEELVKKLLEQLKAETEIEKIV